MIEVEKGVGGMDLESSRGEKKRAVRQRVGKGTGGGGGGIGAGGGRIRGPSMGSGYVVQGNEIEMKELRFPPRE
jgi:hypothetical protein